MKIVSIKTWQQDLGTKRPYSIAYKTVDEVLNAFVEVELENGVVGIGSCNPSPMVVGESVEEATKRLSTDAENFLVGKDIRCFESLLNESQRTFSHSPGSNVAIDIALHDAFCKWLDIPLVDFFGRQHKSLPTSITIGIKNVEETLKEAQEYAEMKFRIFKVKTGLNPLEDAERIIRLHELFPSFMIRVDANQGYSAKDLNDFLISTKEVPMDVIEQPFPVSDFAPQLQHLDKDALSRIAADESVKNLEDVLSLIRLPKSCGIFNFKLMKTGGLTMAKQMASVAGQSGISLMWGCNDESSVSISAALHLALACRNTKFLDLDGSLDLVEDVVTGGFSIENGAMSISKGSGLAVNQIS